jgi:diacylglycerol kinase family enzyme
VTPAPPPLRRIAAIGAIVLAIASVVIAAIPIATRPLAVVATLVQLVVIVAAAWFALTRSGVRRGLAVVVALIAVVGVVASAFDAEGGVPGWVVVLTLAAAVGLAKYALGDTLRDLRRAETPGTPVSPARHGVLFMNLRSGGGKADRFRLVDECRDRGIKPVVLRPGEDWMQRVREVASDGADVIGMAGGDGSQAMVGAIAAELGLAMVVVPAGTRNHLAVDLGLDRNDVVGALDAYGGAVERQVDLAEVNGRVFVNNVSLGLYATIVRSPEYRDAKLDTTLTTLPNVLGPDSRPFDLRFTGPDGRERVGADLIQVSNNPYGTTTRGAGSRPHLDTGRLGVLTLTIDRRDTSRFLADVVTGRLQRYTGLLSWAPRVFEVSADSPIDVGVDGEAREMDPPLRFSIRDERLRVRLPKHAIGYAPAARSPNSREALRDLWRVVLGRPAGLWADVGG